MTASFHTLTVAVSCTLAACSGGGSDPTDPVTETPTEHPTDDGGMPTPTDRVTPMPTPTPTDSPAPTTVTCLESGMCVSHPRVSTAMFSWESVEGGGYPLTVDHLGTCTMEGCAWCEDDPTRCPWVGQYDQHYFVREPACESPPGTGCLYLRADGYVITERPRKTWMPTEPRTFRIALGRSRVTEEEAEQGTIIAVIDVPSSGALISGIPVGGYYLGFGETWDANPGFRTFTLDAWDDGLGIGGSFPIIEAKTTGILTRFTTTSDALLWAPGRWQHIAGAPECPEFADVRVELALDERDPENINWVATGFCPIDVLHTGFNYEHTDRELRLGSGLGFQNGSVRCAQFDAQGNEISVTAPEGAVQLMLMFDRMEYSMEHRWVPVERIEYRQLAALHADRIAEWCAGQ